MNARLFLGGIPVTFSRLMDHAPHRGFRLMTHADLGLVTRKVPMADGKLEHDRTDGIGNMGEHDGTMRKGEVR